MRRQKRIKGWAQLRLASKRGDRAMGLEVGEKSGLLAGCDLRKFCDGGLGDITFK